MVQDKIDQAKRLLSEAFADLNAELRREVGRRRGALAEECWRLRLMSGELRTYFSQSGQDWYVDQVLFKERRAGIFVDVGGYDGVTGSNTLFFEVFRGWTGLLIEPVPALLAKATAVRRCACEGCVVSGDGAAVEFLTVEAGFLQMSGRTGTYPMGILDRIRAHPDHREAIGQAESRMLGEILRDRGIHRVDFLSLDIEGAEFDVLRTFPFDAVEVSVWSIENRTGNAEIHALMTEQGYRLVEFLGVDEIYCRSHLADSVQGGLSRF